MINIFFSTIDIKILISGELGDDSWLLVTMSNLHTILCYVNITGKLWEIDTTPMNKKDVQCHSTHFVFILLFSIIHNKGTIIYF